MTKPLIPNLLERLFIFFRPLQTDDLLKTIDEGYTFFIQGLPLETELHQATTKSFLFQMTTFQAYQLDFSKILKALLGKQDRFHTFCWESITTSIQEAINNAILWSNLEIDPLPFHHQPPQKSNVLEERLQDPLYTQRPVKIQGIYHQDHLTIQVHSYGKKMSSTALHYPQPYGGLDRIKKLSEAVYLLEDGRTLEMRFAPKIEGHHSPSTCH